MALLPNEALNLSGFLQVHLETGSTVHAAYPFDQTSRLLFYLLHVFVRLQFEGGHYSRAAFISLESSEIPTTAG